MNTKLTVRQSLRALGLLATMLLAAASPALASDKSGSDLLVKINLDQDWQDNRIPGKLNAPFDMEMLNTMAHYDVRLRTAFLSRLAAVFAEQGYAGRLAEIDPTLASTRGQPILVIDLKRWATNSFGRFDCYFSARLVTPGGEIDLGTVEYSDVKVERYASASYDLGLRRATDQAMKTFHRQLSQSGKLALLPSRS